MAPLSEISSSRLLKTSESAGQAIQNASLQAMIAHSTAAFSSSSVSLLALGAASAQLGQHYVALADYAMSLPANSLRGVLFDIGERRCQHVVKSRDLLGTQAQNL
ncbi:hypothetical protein CC79DRAFT_1365975 [Sarocladium strictum]|jgi:hypothetical protein